MIQQQIMNASWVKNVSLIIASIFFLQQLPLSAQEKDTITDTGIHTRLSQRFTQLYAKIPIQRLTKEALKSGFEKKAYGTLEHTASIVQTILLILTLTTVALIDKEIKTKKITHEQIDPKELLQLIGNVSLHVVNSGSTWMSIIGSGSMGTIIKNPI